MKNSTSFFGAIKGLSSQLFLVLFAFISTLNLWGQTLSQYNFSTSTTGSLDDMTGATSLVGSGTIISGYNDDKASAVINIGFSFPYLGANYTQFSVNSNGQIRLGSTAIAGTQTSTSSGVSLIVPISGDNSSGFSGDTDPVSYLTTGSTPNRILKIQWKNFQIPYNSSGTIAGNVQVWIHESGKIDFIYGSMYNNSSSSATRSIFLSSSNTSTTVGSVAVASTPTFTISSTLTSNSFSASSNISNLYSANNTSRRTFTWTPQAPCVIPSAQPTSLTFSSITSTGLIGSFTAASSAPSGYLVVQSTSSTLSSNPVDGTTYAVNASLGGGTVVQSGTNVTFTQSGLTANTTYYYFIFSFNSGCTGGPVYLTNSVLIGNGTTCLSTPATPTASSISNSSFTVGGYSVTGATGYTIDISTNSVFTAPISGSPFSTTNTTLPLSGLLAGNTYYVRVTATGAACNSAFSGTLTQLLVCDAPSIIGISASPSAQTLTTISGSFTSATTAPTGYIVVRSLSSTQPVTPAAATALPTVGNTSTFGSGNYVEFINTVNGSWTSISLTPNTTYYYYIFTYNNTSCSGPVYSSSAYSFSQSTLSCTSFSSTIAINGASAVSGVSYPTLSAAIAELQICGISQSIVLELSSGYSNELTNNSLVLPSITGMSPTNTITIRPATGINSLEFTSSVAGGTLSINGGDYWIIDGRPGGVGTMSSNNLFITNTSVSSSGMAIEIINDAIGNTIRYSNLKSSYASTSSGVVMLRGGVTNISGNDNNIIEYNNINGNGLVHNGILCAGGANSNENCLLQFNNIFDVFSAGAATNAISVSTGNSDCIITGNHIYQTAIRSTSAGNNHIGIYINNSSGNNFVISNNFIGGGAVNCSGGAWTLNGAYANRFRAISLTVGTTIASSIQGNTISNFNFSSTSSSTTVGGPWSGIYVSAGKVIIGNISGNTIGSSTGNGSITLNLQTNSGGVSSGIFIEAIASDFNISNNSIGSISTTGTATTISHGFTGITTLATGATIISNNLIGSTSTANSINTSNAATTTGTYQYLNGILNTGNASSIIISNNTIANLINAYVPSSFQSTTNSIVCGISSSAGTASINGNIVRNLNAAANSTNTGLKSAVIGISVTSNAGAIISQNLIHSLKSVNTAGTTISVTGIAYSCATSGTNVIDRNTVYNLENLSPTSGRIQGIYINAGNSNIQNNMICLGNDIAGSSIVLPISIYGIYELAGTNNIYHNTVNIVGNNVTSNTTIPTTGSFYCYAATATRAIRNNIFVNSRSNSASTGGPKNYAIYFPSSGIGGTCNYNLYQATGNGAVFGAIAGSDKATFAIWQAYSPTLDANSIYSEPTFISNTDLHLNPLSNCNIENKGTFIASVSTDYDGDTRSNSTPDMGADEFTFGGSTITWSGSTSTAPGTTTNWVGGTVPGACSNIVIPVGASNYPSYTTLTIDPGTIFTIQSGAQLTISGTLTNNGTLTLESGATLVQGSSSTLAGTGTYNVKQDITGTNNGSTPNGRFWYLGSPVSSASSSAYYASNAANVVKKRDEVNNTWTALSSGTPENLVVGQGYYTQAMGNATINFTGGLLNNGAITIGNLSRTAGQGFEGFNLVSNPYPSYLDWDAVTKTDVGNTMWYRTASGSTAGSMVFDTYVAGTGGIGTNLNGAGVSNLIPPMQSFWVRVNSGSTTGSLGLTNSMRAHFTSINGSVAGLKSTSNERDLFLRMNLLQAGKKDQIIVYVNDIATNGFDQFDGEKMMQAGLLQFYTSAAGKKITINGLNSAKKQQALPITMELPTTGVHSFVIEDLEIDNGLVWLEDKQEEVMQALEPGSVYEFYANSGINAERFVLHFQLIDNTTPINVYNEVNSSASFSGKGASVHAESAGVVVIKLPATAEGVTDIQIRDAAGRLVYTGSTNTIETSVQLEQANGIYYVTLNSASGVDVRKVFIQQ